MCFNNLFLQLKLLTRIIIIDFDFLRVKIIKNSSFYMVEIGNLLF